MISALQLFISILCGWLCRTISVSVGILQQANGSARVKLATCDEGTVVVAGVKAEIMSLEASAGRDDPNVTTAKVQTSASITSAVFSGMPRNERSKLETSIAANIKRTLLTSGALQLDKVCRCDRQVFNRQRIDLLIF